MSRKKPAPPLSLLEQIAIAMRYGHIPLDLAVTLSAPGALENAWIEQPFIDVPFSEVPGLGRAAATRSRGASVFTKTTDFDGPNVYVEILMYTRPQVLFATLKRLRESLYQTTNPSDDLTASAGLQRVGHMQDAIHWATLLTRAMVAHVCGLNGNAVAFGNVVQPGPCSDAPIVTALRACGPPTLTEIVEAAAQRREYLARGQT